MSRQKILQWTPISVCVTVKDFQMYLAKRKVAWNKELDFVESIKFKTESNYA